LSTFARRVPVIDDEKPRTKTIGVAENKGMTDEPIPPVEWSPPYSLDFVAHLEGGCYPTDITDTLMSAVRGDSDGARMLEASRWFNSNCAYAVRSNESITQADD
jgi:hypothetical protein